MDYDGQWLGKKRKCILSPIVAMPRVKHEGLGFDGKMENPMPMKKFFVKAKDMLDLSCSLG
jgi:hypothetical protein